MEIQFFPSISDIPKDFTGIAKTHDCFINLHSFYTIGGMNLFWYINGKMCKSKTLSGVKYHKNKSILNAWNISYEEMFESLTDDEKDIVIWNFDLWR